MSFNVVDSVKGLFNNDLISKASSMFGESEGGIQKAISGLVPSVLAGILSKAGSGGADSLLNMGKEAASSGVLSNVSGLLDNNNLLSKGVDMLKGLFGDKVDSITNLISGFAGVKASTASSLMNLAAPSALGVIGQHAATSNLNGAGLLSFLTNQKDNILSAVPAGLNIAGVLGLGGLGTAASKLSSNVSKPIPHQTTNVTHSEHTATPTKSWMGPLLLLLAVIIVVFLIVRSCSVNHVPEKREAAITETIPVNSAEVTPAVEMPKMESIKVTLPNGVALDAYKGGIEDQLVAFLSDASKKPDKATWFDFDNLNFETGSSKITKESQLQIDNLTAILKAFPKATLKIGGYTDKTGDSTSNVKLSQQRAESVSAALVTAGSDKAQIAGAEGYGSQFAKAAADAPDEDRKKDRRIAVSVRSK